MVELTLSKNHQDGSTFEENIIPAGSKGELIDIIIENGEVRFLLNFGNLVCDWVDLDELEEKY